MSRPRDRPEPDLPARYRARVLAAFPRQIGRIVVFGSRARGEAHAESDWDFAVFFRNRPGEAESDKLLEIDWELGQSFGCTIQSLGLSGEEWLAGSELACNIRDHGLIIYGPNDVPRIKRPVMRHASAALSKAERFAEQAAECRTPRHTRRWFTTATTPCSTLRAVRSSPSKALPAPSTGMPSTPLSPWSSFGSAPRRPLMPPRS